MREREGEVMQIERKRGKSTKGEIIRKRWEEGKKKKLRYQDRYPRER